MSHELPALPYAYDALEPHIDEATMRIHHDKHHAGYTAKLNDAIKDTKFACTPLAVMLSGLDRIPEDIRGAIRNNGGGYVNHSLFWDTLSPDGGGEPTGNLATEIDAAFGCFADFKEKFNTAAATRFGSGWAWLVLKDCSSLVVYSTPNQDSPFITGDTPLLGLDVWEHAYYLKYQNRRPDYIEAFWNVVNWARVSERLVGARTDLDMTSY